jgi:hypothetical protein
MESYNELERFAFLVEAKQKVTSDRGSKVRIGCEPLGDGLRPANSCRSEAQTGSSIAAGRNPTPNFVGLGQVRSVAPSLQIS